MSILEDMRKLVREHDDMANEAFDLWAWLPSYHFAQKAHGDYASDVGQPTFAEIMKEACMVMSYATGYNKDFDNEDTRNWLNCGCEECQLKPPTKEAVLEALSKFRKEQG